MTSISWIILTFNRGDIVRESVTHNFNNMGYDPAKLEIVWVDNGSSDKITREFMQSMDPEVAVLYNENRGVARGFNTCMGLASNEYIVITGSDMKMPDNWLKTMVEYVTKIQETGSACIYSTHWTLKKERLRKQYGVQYVNGLPLVHAMALERRIFRRSLLTEFGYYSEKYGLYGYDDIAYSARIEKVCDELGLLYYVIPDLVAEHMDAEGINRAYGKEATEYHAMKHREATDHAKKVELARQKELGWPRWSPFL